MKAVVFDFDGTLSYNTPNAWRQIWSTLGFESEEMQSKYRQYFNLFRGGKINYQTWCDVTCKIFIQRGMTESFLNDLASKTQIIPGFTMFAHILKQQNIQLHIVSGGIESLIKISLGNNNKFIDNISANKMIFDRKGNLKRIEATKFDFLGKAQYIKALMAKNNWTPADVCFVGNSMNDEYVYTTGCKTICINPENADYLNTLKWNKVYKKCDNLLEIMPEILEKKQDSLDMVK